MKIQKNGGKDPEILVLKKAHLLMGLIGALIMTIVAPAVTVTLAFSNAKAEVNDKIDTIQKENVEKFARKEDVANMSTKVDQVLVGLARLEGYLSASKGSSHNAK